MLIGRIVFLIVFSGLFFLLNYYLYRKIRWLFAHVTRIRRMLPYIFSFLALAFPTGRILASFMHCRWANDLVVIGSFWFAAVVYLFLAALLIDLGRLILRVFGIQVDHARFHGWRLGIGWSVCLITLGILIWGYWCAYHPVIHRLDLDIPARSSRLDSLHLVMVSDIHLGRVLGSDHLEKMVEQINGLNPELVVIAGDMMDDETGHIIREDKAAALRELMAPRGVYAVLGNHDLFDRVEPMLDYMQGLGVRYLRDSTLKFPGEFQLVGRDDRMIRRLVGESRASLAELRTRMDPGLPSILIDHTPFGLEEASEQGIDLQLSGHTHGGQLFPITLLVGMMYRQAHGYYRLGDTHYYISSGYGSWGPPIRVGTRAEIVDIHLRWIKPKG